MARTIMVTPRRKRSWHRFSDGNTVNAATQNNTDLLSQARTDLGLSSLEDFTVVRIRATLTLRAQAISDTGATYRAGIFPSDQAGNASAALVTLSQMEDMLWYHEKNRYTQWALASSATPTYVRPFQVIDIDVKSKRRLPTQAATLHLSALSTVAWEIGVFGWVLLLRP